MVVQEVSPSGAADLTTKHAKKCSKALGSTQKEVDEKGKSARGTEEAHR